ncbi:UNVERIFIED_CONTAM: hypothetical protein Sradi_4037300 [Sesamum radiatum]|uniref:Retrotransposon gag domain-containing protein n=1 Tax=Sesamum radiatum TaxID=300843 RepID=A0AAW2PJL6_SESRA
MQTRSRAREVPEVEDAPERQVNGAGQAPPRALSPPRVQIPPPGEQAPLNGQASPPPLCTGPPPGSAPRQEATIQLTQEALLALIQDASARAAAQAVAQFAANHPVNPPPPSPCRSRELSSAPEEEEQRQEEVNSRISRPKVAQEQSPPQSRQPSIPPPSRRIKDPYLPLAVAPPRRSPFAPAILAEALPAGVKVSNLSEYDGTGDPQEHLDKFYAKIDCLEQLTQRFLHHFSMNKRAPKIAAFLFTIRQKENECLRDYMQRFVEAVHEVPHVNHELLASIIQQNLLLGRFKESIAGKPPRTMEDLLMRSQKYIRIEESISRTLPLALRGRTERRRKSRRMKNANT